MITPHLPPEHAANALLPIMLGNTLSVRGVKTRLVSHPPEYGGERIAGNGVIYVPRRGRGAVSRSIVGAMTSAVRMAAGAARAVRESDVVHLHGNGLIVEVGWALAQRYRKPCVVTLYGTDVWDHDRVRHARFGRAVRGAARRVFYSRGLLEFARALDLAPDPSVVIYAPVETSFRAPSEDERRSIRRELGIGDEPLLLTVKRLHRVGGHETLLRALPQVLREHPDAKAWFVGEGGLKSELAASIRQHGLEAHVRLVGGVSHEEVSRYCAAADLFVLPSTVESWGTVMLEALACGTPVVATNTPGGLEVRDHFPQDVTLVEKRDPQALAAAILRGLRTRARASAATAQTLREQFDVERCAESYLAVYRQALAGASFAG